jgi:hypothetical protein
MENIKQNQELLTQAFRAYREHLVKCPVCGGGTRCSRCKQGQDLVDAMNLASTFRVYEFTGHDQLQVGKKVLSPGACCNNVAATMYTNPDGTIFCSNCGTTLQADNITIAIGRSIKCPAWCEHHIGTTCPICGIE